MPPSPEQLARAQRLLNNPNIPESEKAALRAKLGMGGGATAAAPATGEAPIHVNANQAKFLAEPKWPQSYKDSLVRHLADGGAVGTKLSPADEARFQNEMRTGEGYRQWMQEFTTRNGGPPTLDDPDYDYRAAWKAGIRPERYKHDGQYHWSSSLPSGQMLKSENHPTAWMEHFMRATGKDPNDVGVKSKEEGDAYLARMQGGTRGVRIGDAQNIREAEEPNDREPDRDVDDLGGGGATAPGASGDDDPYLKMAARSESRPATGLPGPSPSESGADRVLGYLRSGLHGIDRSVTFGLGTSLGEMVDPGTRARGEAAAAKYPVAQVLGMLGGALIPSGLAAQAGRAGGATADAVIRGGGALARVGRGAVAGATGAALQDVGEDVAAGRPVEGAGGAALAGGAIGGVLSGLGAAARGVQNAIRDPADQVGRDIASAKNIGGDTHWLKGVERGPVYEGAEREARAAAQAGRPISPSGVAEQRAVPELGRSVQADIDTRLGKMGAENAEAGNEDLVSAQPLIDRALNRLRQSMRDQQPLHGTDQRYLADAVKKNANNIRIVDITDSALDSVDPENILEAGEAAAMGLIPKSKGMDGKAVIITPRMLGALDLKTMRGIYADTGRINANNTRQVGVPEDAKALAGAVNEAHAQLGPEAIDRLARQAASHQELDNVIYAAGLPKGTEKVNVGDTETATRLGGALRSYRTRGHEAADQVLDQLAGRGPLRGALDEAAGVAAIERMRREASIPMNASGIGNYGLKDAAKLRAEALLRYLENGVGATARPVGRGLIPASVSAAQPTRRQP